MKRIVRRALMTAAVSLLLLCYALTPLLVAGGKRQRQEAAVDMTVSISGAVGCDVSMTTNHFTLAAGAQSQAIALTFETCPPSDSVVFFGYETERARSRQAGFQSSDVVMTAFNEDTGIPVIDTTGWLTLEGTAPTRVTFFVRNQGRKDMTVRLRSFVYLSAE